MSSGITIKSKSLQKMLCFFKIDLNPLFSSLHCSYTDQLHKDQIAHLQSQECKSPENQKLYLTLK